MKSLLGASLFLIILGGFAANAAPILFGPEFEFSSRGQFFRLAAAYFSHSPSLLRHSLDFNKKKLQRMYDRYHDLQNTRPFTLTGNPREQVRITYEDGFYFIVKNDFGVLEVTAKPSSILEFEAHTARLQKDIFDVMAQEGFTPGKGFGLGNGHINFDLASAFEGDVILFRNFIVDYTNHSELPSGIHLSRWDRKNAKSIAKDPKTFLAFKKIIEQVDRGEIKTVSELLELIRTEVYDRNKGFALSFSAFDKTRGELKALRHQSSPEEFIELCRLFEKRIAFLRTQKKTVELLPRNQILSKWNRLKRYRDYVVETGLDWKTYRALLPRALRCRAALGSLHY